MFSINNLILANKGFYINLPSSEDRRENVNNQIKKYNIQGLERFEALTDEMIQFSCTKSHLCVFEESLEENLEIIFVAEDDFEINDECYYPYGDKTFNTVLKDVYNDLKNVEWDVILLGCNPKSTLIPVTQNLSIINKSTGAWAYIIKKRAYEYILNNSNYKRDYIAIDDYLPLLNSKGFVTLTTTPMLINHAVGFVSTLQPKGPVDYNLWIKGNYDKFLYRNYPDGNLNSYRIEKELTIVVVGHFMDNFIFYLNYLLYSLPEELNKCRFLIHYDYGDTINNNKDIFDLRAYFRDKKSDLNVDISFGFGGLISSIKTTIEKVKTPYFLFLEHDWVFIEKNNIDFKSLLNSFNKHKFINATWFSKDDNQMRGSEISKDKNGVTTPFKIEDRVSDVNLITTCRWSNNPCIFRTQKMIEWFYKYINNEYVGITNQRQHNVEENMIKSYRELISIHSWDDIKDEWGTYLFGNIGDGPFVAHTNASERYQNESKSQPEINGEEYIKNNPLRI